MFQKPWRSGWPSGVRGGVHVFADAFAFAAAGELCPAAGTCSSSAIIMTGAIAAARAFVEVR